MSFLDHYRGRKVLVTGHTGFKGSWLTLWLNNLGAEVTGWSIDIPTQPSLFELAHVDSVCDHHFGDINDAEAIQKFVADGNFQTVFHLAAQPLVRLSYSTPLETLQTNVIGTANVLEAVRSAGRECAIVAVTSDKCYANDGSIWGLRECDPMGGSDPYSMSKGAAELVIDSWRRSYFSTGDDTVRLASARAGNVIGGGDWAADRIITDSVSALIEGRTIEIRNPTATRPWQHVLEPLSGYLWLGAALATDWNGGKFDSAWNFGPPMEGVRPVSDLVDRLVANWGSGDWSNIDIPQAPKEAKTLSLNCDKAIQLLEWRPVWSFEKSVAETTCWYRTFAENASRMNMITQEQIDRYLTDAVTANITWATARPEFSQ
jgi:CDP-glucose 4,6-dehydratase